MLHVVWWAGIAAAMGFIAFTFGTFLGNALAAAGLPPTDADLGKTGHMIAGLAAIWLVFGVHVSGVKTYGRVVSVLLVLVVGVAVVVCVVGFATAPADFLHAASARSGVPRVPPAAPAGFNLSAFLSVCALFMFAYGGLSGAPSLAGEARDAPSTLPRAIAGVTASHLVPSQKKMRHGLLFRLYRHRRKARGERSHMLNSLKELSRYFRSEQFFWGLLDAAAGQGYVAVSDSRCYIFSEGG